MLILWQRPTPRKQRRFIRVSFKVIHLESNLRWDVERIALESISEDEHDKEARLKEQESTLVKLAELYRDQKFVSGPPFRIIFAAFPDIILG